MGAKSPLAGALFPSVQQRVLALLFAEPDRSFRTAELIHLARGGTGGVHRLLTRLAEAGWVTVTPVGNQRHYRANRACPAFAELRALVLKVVAPPAREAARRGAPARPGPREETAPPTPPPEPGDGWKTW